MNTIKKAKAPPGGAVGVSVQQVIALAISKAEFQLEELTKARVNDEHWDVCDDDVDNAVELSLHQIRRMQTLDFSGGFCSFITDWYVAASAINLAVKTFSRSDGFYSRSLQDVCAMFAELARLVEFTDTASIKPAA